MIPCVTPGSFAPSCDVDACAVKPWCAALVDGIVGETGSTPVTFTHTDSIPQLLCHIGIKAVLINILYGL